MPFNDTKLTEPREERFFTPFRACAHKLILGVIWLHLPFLAILLPETSGDYLLGGGGGLSLSILATLAYLGVRQKRTLIWLNGGTIACLSLIATVLQGSSGLPFFICIAFMVLYLDSAAIVLAAAIVMAGHWGIAALGSSGLLAQWNIGLLVADGSGEVGDRILTDGLLAVAAVFLAAFFRQNYQTVIKERGDMEDEVVADRRIIMEQKERLINSAKLSTLGEMAGGIAHEINNPLGAVMLRSFQIQRLLSKEPPDVKKSLELTREVEATGRRISQIVSGLRSLARSGESDPFELTATDKILDEAISLSQSTLERDQIEVRIRQAGSYEIECRHIQIAQVLINLLSNARHAIKGSKEKWIEVEVKGADNNVWIAVTDSGPGIPKEIQDKILEPFFTTKRDGEGTGLGLSISKGIVEDHGGRFYLDRASPNTRFVMILPKRHAAGTITKKVA